MPANHCVALVHTFADRRLKTRGSRRTRVEVLAAAMGSRGSALHMSIVKPQPIHRSSRCPSMKPYNFLEGSAARMGDKVAYPCSRPCRVVLLSASFDLVKGELVVGGHPAVLAAPARAAGHGDGHPAGQQPDLLVGPGDNHVTAGQRELFSKLGALPQCGEPESPRVRPRRPIRRSGSRAARCGSLKP